MGLLPVLPWKVVELELAKGQDQARQAAFVAHEGFRRARPRPRFQGCVVGGCSRLDPNLVLGWAAPAGGFCLQQPAAAWPEHVSRGHPMRMLKRYGLEGLSAVRGMLDDVARPSAPDCELIPGRGYRSRARTVGRLPAGGRTQFEGERLAAGSLAQRQLGGLQALVRQRQEALHSMFCS